MKILIIIFISFLVSCARGPINSPENAMRMIDEDSVNIVDDQDLETLKKGITRSVEYLNKNPEKEMIFGTHHIKSKEYADKLLELLKVDTKAELKEIIKDKFDIYEVYGKHEYGKILLTSYYEPVIEGSYVKTDEFSQPLYKLPDDLVEVSLTEFRKINTPGLRGKKGKLTGRIEKRAGYPNRVVPYFTRSEIDGCNKLSGKNLELFWVDPIEAFFLQIQGSGQIKVGNKRFRVGYAGQNGRKYVSIGKYLTHVIPKNEMSLQKIEEHLKKVKKAEMNRIFSLNPSYVFFKKLGHEPLTTTGAGVIPGRTIAIDDSMFPLGAMAFLSFKKPMIKNGKVEMSEDDISSRLVFAHDTGGAIDGPGRADLFWGSGSDAKFFAGHMRHPANLYFFGPK